MYNISTEELNKILKNYGLEINKTTNNYKNIGISAAGCLVLGIGKLLREKADGHLVNIEV